MKIINKLTLRHMKLNKRRTVVTMIGIIIAVAMITAVSTVAYSIMDFMARKAMVTQGHFHLKFANYYYKDNQRIVDELDIEQYSLMRVVGDYFYKETNESDIVIEPYANDETSDDYSSALRIVAVEDNYYEMLSVNLISGEYPKNDRELLISDRMGAFNDKQVGDKVKIGEIEYTVCGIILGEEFEWRMLAIPYVMVYPMYTRLDTDTLQDSDLVSGYFYIDGVISNLEKQAEELRSKLQNAGVPTDKLIGEDETWYCDGVGVSYNYDVLTYLGVSKYSNINAIMDSFKLILIIIIMVGSVSLIANGFIISVSERGKYLGMLASVGATKKQKRSSVYFEGFLEGIIGIPLGIFAGIGGIAITFELIEPLVMELSGTGTELKVVVNSTVIIWAVVFSILTIFLSAYFPARRASKIAPIDAIRQNKDIKMTAKSVKTMGITRKLFGFEGELALKNLKRNKKRYRVTVFSMFISLTLFISVYSIVYYTKESAYLEMENINADMSLFGSIYSPDNEGIKDALEMEKEFISITDRLFESASEYIDEAQRYIELSNNHNLVDTDIYEDKTMYSDKYKEYLNKCGIENMRVGVSMLAMSEEDLRNYLKDIGVSYDDFVADKDNVILFDNISTKLYKDDERIIYSGRAFRDDIKKLAYSHMISESKEVITDGKLMGDEYVEKGEVIGNFKIFHKEEKLMGLSEEIAYILVTPEKASEIKSYGARIYCNAFFNVNDDDKVTELFEELIGKPAYESDYYLYNFTKQVEEMENSMLLISIFVYGFIILMTLICVANIVNTISTSLAFRRREFAMLKSVGMTDGTFNRMIVYESGFYGVKAILFGLPVATGIMLFVRYLMGNAYGADFGIPWFAYVIAIIGVFIVIGVTMLYSSRKIKKANVIEALRDENA